jgi:hypothetical protein
VSRASFPRQQTRKRSNAAIRTGHVGQNRIHTSNQDYHGSRSFSIANLRRVSRSTTDVDILGGDVRTEASRPHHGTARSGKVRLGMHLPAAYPWRSISHSAIVTESQDTMTESKKLSIKLTRPSPDRSREHRSQRKQSKRLKENRGHRLPIQRIPCDPFSGYEKEIGC